MRVVRVRCCAILMALLGLVATRDQSFAQVPPGFVIENAFPNESFTLPVQVVFMPDGRKLVVEKEGRIWVVSAAGAKLPTPFIDIDDKVLSNDDRGLLGVALDPDFTTNRWVYLLFTVDPDSNGVDDNIPAYGRLERYQANAGNPNLLDPATRQVLIGTNFATGVPEPPRNRHHMVGTLRFGADKTLMVGSGDAANADITDRGGSDPSFGTGLIDPSEDIGSFRARTLNSMDGKILRVDKETGQGLSSNPYWDGNPTSDRSRVWLYGLRNPFRFAFRPGTGSTNPALGQPGVLYIGDVGWNTTEEFDIARTGGLNFAWPCFEGAFAQSDYQAVNNTTAHNTNVLCPAAPSSENPVAGTAPALWWSHQVGGGANPPGLVGNCAIGGAFYTGTSYPAEYRGRYYLADFGAGWIKRIEVDANDNVLSVNDFISGAGAVVDVEVDPTSGDLYYVDIVTQSINRIRYGVGNLPPLISASMNPTSGYSPLTVTVTASASTDPEGQPLTYLWAFGDGFTSTNPDTVYTYQAEGQYTATVTVSDGQGGVSLRPFLIVVGQTAPPGVIVRPSDGAFFSQNESVALEASPADTAQGPATYRWDVDFGHDNHIHPSTDVFFGPVAAFVATTPQDGQRYYYRFRLGVTQGPLTSNDTVYVYPKLNLTAGALSFTPTSPGVNQLVQVNATVRSNGERGSSITSWQVLEGPIVLAGGSLAPIMNGDSLVVTTMIGPFGNGAHTVRFVADPVDSLIETDELDNEVQTTIDVGKLMAGYALNEGSGPTAGDVSGEGNNGTLAGATWTPSGKNGGALSFNGSSGYVDLDNPVDLQLTGSMTLSAWVNASSSPADDGQIVSKSTDSQGWQLKSSPDTGPQRFAVAISGVGGRAQRNSLTVRSLNTWYHVAGVYDAAARTLHIYVNGVLDDGLLTGTVPPAQTDAAVDANLGRRTGGYYFAGRIDDVRIYNRALTGPEIVSDMSTAVGTPPVVPAPDPPGVDDGAPQFALDPPSPNPVGASPMSISFRMGEAGPVRLELFNVLGERVALVVDEVRRGGAYVERFDAAALPSGIYFVKLTAGRFTGVRKIVRVR